MTTIYFACPEYHGALYPKFDPLKINESKISGKFRFKEAWAEYDENTNVGNVDWLMQESDELGADVTAEIIRAFKANGAKPGCEITVKYGIRDYGLTHTTTLTVK